MNTAHLCRLHSLILRPPCPLDKLIPLIQAGTPALVASQGALPLRDVLAEGRKSAQKVGGARESDLGLLLVGPEGDFTEEELAALKAAGAQVIGLGPNRLRVETAAIAVLTGALLLTEGQ